MNETETRELLAKADQSLKAAKSLLHDGFVDFSASRSYYAMFYAMEALLLSIDLAYSKHSAVIAAFGKEFVKSGKFDPKFHAYVLEAFDLRNAGDYGTMHSVPEEKARELIRKGQSFLRTVRGFLKSSHNR